MLAALLGGLAVASGIVIAFATRDSVATTAPAASASSIDDAGRGASAPEHPSSARIEVPLSLERSCRTICDRSRRLACENASQCMPNCLAMGSVTPCTDAITTLYQCLVGQPVQNWECAPDGVAAIKDGFCDDAQRQAVTCMAAKMSH
jgi:hypothetical protein